MARDEHPVIVCPLAFEARALRGAGDVRCCGVGPRSVRTWAAALDGRPRIVVLAGLAGALRSKHPAGSAHVVTRVVADTEDQSNGADSWTPTLAIGRSSCVVVSVDRVVNRADDRLALAARCGADIVDLESAAFAMAAVERGWRWGIVRGISDAPEEPLPAEVETWIDASGRVRVGRVITSLARRPQSAIPMMRLRRRSEAALREVALRLAEVLG